MKRILVNGAGGFIGGHLVKRLKAEGCWVRAVDLKRHEFSASPADEFIIGDLRDAAESGFFVRAQEILPGDSGLSEDGTEGRGFDGGMVGNGEKVGAALRPGPAHGDVGAFSHHLES